MTPELSLPDRSLLVAASYVILRRGNEVLLHLRRGTGYLDDHWATLAGHVDPGESAAEAASREAMEEAGVRVDQLDLHPLTTLHRFEVGGPQREQRADFFFEVRDWSGDPHIVEPEKCADMRWFRLDALPHPVVPHELEILNRLERPGHPGDMPAILVVRSTGQAGEPC
ncbi:NUDIX domain-containing protein [Cellulomonas sp. KRMCY2]|uniref:NUDIX domain-containing protein n=1 Tax=Cellulomonas sp. KRMCY2 TaxID=1304865 RepID=UPI00045EAC2E|nr:NUDIX domain-containing protein [Cellulomonas sp. KRMCY2]